MHFSLIIPIYNRPDEIDELLESLTKQTYTNEYEIVIIEDGSTITCNHIIEKYSNLNVNYYFKPNSGPGDSRNYGMAVAKGDYFIILDSDCIIPPNYLQTVDEELSKEYAPPPRSIPSCGCIPEPPCAPGRPRLAASRW